MPILFTKTKSLILKIDNFIDIAAESSLHFKKAVIFYLEGRTVEFEERLKIIRDSESRADHLRMDVETQLYRHTLIPESRGDVLGILESMDDIINSIKSAVVDFSIEQPSICENVNHGFRELLEVVCSSVKCLVQAVRAYFYELYAVKDHLHLVKFNEKEADRIAERIKREIFSSELSLSHKTQLRFFTMKIDSIADAAEDVADRIAIATIKRSF